MREQFGTALALSPRVSGRRSHPRFLLSNCDGVLSVQLVPGTTPDRVGLAQFTILDLKRIISAAAIDTEALAAEQNERNPVPKGSAPKL